MSDVDDGHIDELIGQDEPDEEVAVEEEAAPEPEADQPEQDEQDDQPRGNLNAALRESRELLKAEREQRSVLQQRLELNDKALQRLEARLAEMNKPAEPKGPEIPRYEDDPEGYYRGTIAHLQQQVEQISQRGQQQDQQSEEQGRLNEMLNLYATDVRTYSKEAPDFNDAYQHFGTTLDGILETLGYTDPAERARLVQVEEGRIVGQALRNKASPAKAIYTFAQKMGYQGPQAEQKGVPNEDKIVRLQNGQFASKSLQGTKGKPPTNLSVQQLLEMEPGPEFDAAWEKARKAGLL